MENSIEWLGQLSVGDMTLLANLLKKAAAAAAQSIDSDTKKDSFTKPLKGALLKQI